MPVSHSPLRNIIILFSKGFHSAVLRKVFFCHIPQFISVSAFLFHFKGWLRKEQVCECVPRLSSELVTVYVSSTQMTMWLEILLKQTFNQIQSLMRPSLILSHFLSKASLWLAHARRRASQHRPSLSAETDGIVDSWQTCW